MKFYATLIVKDDSELESFKVAVKSIIKHVDGLLVVANGKETTEIEAFTLSQGGEYYYLPWKNDFSEQRNFLTRKLPKDCDYYFWMDSDDILIGGENLRDLVQIARDTKKDILFFEYWYGCSFNGKPAVETFQKVDVMHYRERIIKKGSHYWKGRLHETPVPVMGSKDAYTKIAYKDVKVAVMHTKTMDDARATMKRNQEILEIQLEEEKKYGEADPRTLLYLMKIYAELEGDYLTKCIEMGDEYLIKSGWDEERATACELMAICYNKIGNQDKSITLLHRGIQEYPHNPLIYLRLAKAYLLTNRLREAQHWLEIGVQLPLDKRTAGISHVQEMKILSAQVLLQLKYQTKEYKAAQAAADILRKEQPNEKNDEQYLFISDIVDLEEACKTTDDLITYLDSIGNDSAIINILNTLPSGITSQPFAIKWRQKITKPRVWGDKEICYFANFGGNHFEKWDEKSLDTGIGGSETAVIELSKQWAKQGYKVTIYGDPEKAHEVDGVTYLPWYYFNKNDVFNIFIQWRSSYLAPVIKCKKFLVDLHDMYAENQLLESVPAVDQFMVKSEYHKGLSKIENMQVISNGISI